MLRTGVAAFVVVLCAGCGGSGHAATATLSIETQTGTDAPRLRASQATLQCDGAASATGFLRDIAGPACALVHRGTVEKVAADQRSRRACSQIYGGPQRAHITGTVDGHRVDLTVTSVDGCGTAAWQTLEPLLGDPQRTQSPKAPLPSTTTTVPPIIYQVERGDTLTVLAQRFGVSVIAIVRRNHLAHPDHLTEGQRLLIPPAPPVRFVITPGAARAGDEFQLKLTGAKPSEAITFEIDTPRRRYTGPPHTASVDGVVTAIYHSSAGDPAGTYHVIAEGKQGTTARASFRVGVADTTPTDTSP